MAKKILALVMAIALVVCFAVSASAASVSTTTEYLNGEAKVVVNVTSAGENANVTYYAYNDEGPVFVYQTKANAQGAATFDFVTDFDNVGSKVLVGYEGSAVVADGEDEIEDASKYTIKYGETEVGWVYEGEAEKTVPITPVIPEHHSVTAISATGATTSKEVCTDNGDGTWSVVLSNITDDVIITVTTAEIVIPGYEGTLDCVDAAIKVVTVAGNDEVEENLGTGDYDVDAAVGDVKLTVCGKFVGEYDEYGIIIFESAITETELWSDAFAEKYADYKYEAKTETDGGKFAVQIIDTSKTGAIIDTAKPYYAAVYAYSETEGVYYVDAFDTELSVN